MTALPPDWARAKLGDVADTRLGKMLSKKSRTGAGSRPYLRNKNVQWGRFDLSDVGEMDFSPAEAERFRVIPGDLLVCEGGEIGRAAIWRGPIEWIGYQKALHRIRPYPDVTPEFLLYLFMWLAQSNAFAPFATGTTIRHLPQEGLRELPIPVPPPRVQQVIVDIIEEQFSRLDAAERSLGAGVRRLNMLRRDTESFLLHGDWPWVKLGEIAEVVGGITKDSKRQTDPLLVEVPYLRVANVQRGRLDLSTVTTIRVTKAKAAALTLQPGDVLFNEGGDRDKLGRGWVWSGEIGGCIHQNHVFRARLSEEFDPRFVSWHGNTFGRRWFEEHGRQTTNLASLNLSTLKAFPVPLLPLEEQRRRVGEIERQRSAFDALERAIARTIGRGSALRRSILECAFSGSLTPSPHR